jgi:2'-5' RNA ligase
MARELDLRLVATPTVELPNVGLGNLSSLTDSERSIVHELASVATRRKAAAESKALPDGSFPIRSVPELKKAVQAYGRAKNKPKAKRFIIRRARGLGRTDLLPEAWGVQTSPAAVLAAGDGGPENGIMVALYPPPEMADKLAGGQPGDLSPGDMHVTLAYLGTTDDVTPEQLNAAREAIASVANTQTPFTAQVQGVGSFHAPESDDPHWYSVDAPGLAALRTKVVQALESVGVQPRTEHDFTPHMTVRYGGEQPELPEGGGEPWDVHGLVLASGPRHEVYSLGHDHLPDDEGDGNCLICGGTGAEEFHSATPPPAWMDAMDNPALAGQVDELVTDDGRVVEFVKAPGPCSLDRSPKHNWVEKEGGLPNYICQVARAVARGGHSLESAIPIAIATIKKWAAGGSSGNGKKVSAAVQARAAAALAEWEAKKAKAHVTGLEDNPAGEFFHWRHGWIPLPGTDTADKAKKDAARRERFAASRAKNATRDAAKRARLEAHRRALDLKKHATPQGVSNVVGTTATGSYEVRPIDGPSALELEVSEFASSSASGPPTAYTYDEKNTDPSYAVWWKQLQKAGWKGDPGDKAERIYAPSPEAAAQAERTRPKGVKGASHAKPPSQGGSKSSSGSSSGSRTYKRQPAGQRNGGQFAPGPARDAAAAKVQADPAATALYASIMGTAPGARAGAVQKLSDADLQKATQVLYSSRTSDPDVVAARIAVANEMTKRGFDIKHYGALGGGLPGVKSSPVVHAAPQPASKLPARATTTAAPAPRAPGAPAKSQKPIVGRNVAASASAEEFAWNPDVHAYDRHGQRIAKGHTVHSPTGAPGKVVGNAPARGKRVVQVTQPVGPPVAVPADQTEVLDPENAADLDDMELKNRHDKISADIAGHTGQHVAEQARVAKDPTASANVEGHLAEIDRLNKKRQSYADEITRRSAAIPGGTVTKSVAASAASDPALADFTYHWNPETQETFRVAENGDISVFAPAVDEQEQASWQAIDTYNGATQLADIARLPKVEDRDTLEVILGSSLALVADAGVAVRDASEAADVADEAPEEIGPAEGEDTTGRRFRIPILIPEGVPTGDRRIFAEGALEAKEPPMPLLWQRETDEGHKRSVIVGRIDKIERLESGGLGNAEGVFDTHDDAQEAARQVRERYLTGVSGDVDQFESELSQTDTGDDSMLIKHGRLVAATLVAKPAFQEASIEMIPEEGETTVITASGGPLLPPKSWFFKPSLDGPTMLTVTDDGRVFGHIAEWDTPHLSNPDLKAPRSTSNYRYFNRKPLRTAEGEDVKVGQLTLVGGHAKLAFDPDRATRHYDDTRSAVADVVAGEDEFGIWVSGAMRPDVTPTQLRAFRASEPSGDWRMRDGQLELCAICQVNTAGFPVTPRALVSSGEVISLVAAGMVGHEAQRAGLSETVAQLSAEVAALKAEREAERRAALLESVQALRA